MNEQKLIYEVQNLSFSYGEHQVLQEMSFSLQKGKITTLIGANGCGKSTLFQLLTRNLKPDQGEICLYAPVSYGTGRFERGEADRLRENSSSKNRKL